MVDVFGVILGRLLAFVGFLVSQQLAGRRHDVVVVGLRVVVVQLSRLLRLMTERWRDWRGHRRWRISAFM